MGLASPLTNSVLIYFPHGHSMGFYPLTYHRVKIKAACNLMKRSKRKHSAPLLASSETHKIIQWTMCGRPPLLLANYEVAATEGQSADIDELSINILASNPSHHFLVLKSLTPHTCWSLSDARLSLDKFHNQENKDKHVQYIYHSTRPANNRPHVGDIRSDALPAPKDHG